MDSRLLGLGRQREDFVWVSGVWRVTPPGRKWTPGHWITTAGGYRWVSGFWESDGVGELEYRQPPPESLELGPSSAAPSEIHFWAPGCWVPFDYEYRWRPGYWHPYQENWVWVPACYIWTPSGCLYISGYWDYRFALRGQLFAPVYFPNRIYGQPGFSYSPSCIVDSGIISLHLFVRPDCRHYYFGDYYGPAYYGRQIYPFFELHVSGRGYDPLYVHNCLHFRQRGVKLSRPNSQLASLPVRPLGPSSSPHAARTKRAGHEAQGRSAVAVRDDWAIAERSGPVAATRPRLGVLGTGRAACGGS